MSLPGFSVRQAVLVNLLFMVCMVAGFVSFSRLPVDFFPDISFNVSSIGTIWSGASAEEVERLITTKIEEEVRDLPDIRR